MGAAVTKSFSISTGTVIQPQKVGIFGPGKIGKTGLATHIAQVGIKPVVIDLENGSAAYDTQRINGIETWRELRSVLQNHELLAPFGAVILDSATKAEELAARDVLENIPHEKGHKVNNMEDYGFGKGNTHLYETFLQILGDLDSLQRAGKWIVVIMHDCVEEIHNPYGENWDQYQPRLQHPKKNPKNSIRLRMKEWLDHLFFVGYDISVNTAGKATGHGSRTIYVSERPTHMAGSRYLSEPVVYHRDSAEIWNLLLNKGE